MIILPRHPCARAVEPDQARNTHNNPKRGPLKQPGDYPAAAAGSGSAAPAGLAHGARAYDETYVRHTVACAKLSDHGRITSRAEGAAAQGVVRLQYCGKVTDARAAEAVVCAPRKSDRQVSARHIIVSHLTATTDMHPAPEGILLRQYCTRKSFARTAQIEHDNSRVHLQRVHECGRAHAAEAVACTRR